MGGKHKSDIAEERKIGEPGSRHSAGSKTIRHHGYTKPSFTISIFLMANPALLWLDIAGEAAMTHFDFALCATPNMICRMLIGRELIGA